MFKKAALISTAAIAVLVFTGCSDDPKDDSKSNQISVSSKDGELTIKEGSQLAESQEEANELFNKLFDAASNAIEEGVEESGMVDGSSSEVGGGSEISVFRSAGNTQREDTTFSINGLSGDIEFYADMSYTDYGSYDITNGTAKATFYNYSADNSLYIGGSIGLNLRLKDYYEVIDYEDYTHYNYLSTTGNVSLAVALAFSSDEFSGTLGFEAAANINSEKDPGYTITKATATVDGYTIPQDLVNSKLDTFIEQFNGSTTDQPISINE